MFLSELFYLKNTNHHLLDILVLVLPKYNIKRVFLIGKYATIFRRTFGK